MFIENSTGDIEIINCNKTGNIDVETSTGNVSLSNVNCNKLDISISTGDTRLNNVILKEDLNIDGSTGSVYLDSFDAANIYITLSTGDVKGIILSNKFFIANSGTGYVSVPETREGGECKITVGTGNISITSK